MNIKKYFLFTIAAFIMLALNSCKKSDFSPSIPDGTRFSHITLKGYTTDNMQVRVGPRSVVAGYVNEDISSLSFEVPFAADQNLNRVVFYKEDGSAPYATSQINFKTPGKDTTMRIFYDGKTFFQNPVFPVAASGKMLFRVNFQSTASTYKGLVDLELHEAKSVAKEIIDPKTGDVIDVKITTTIKPAIAKKIANVKPTEFSDYVEIPALALDPDPNVSNFYVIYFRLPGTANPLPYPTTSVTVDPYAVLNTTPDYTALIVIKDVRLTTEKPNRITYLMDDKMLQFF